MTCRVLVIGLDSGEATLLDRWSSEGELPSFRDLLRRSAEFRLDSPMNTLPGAIWPELNTGRSVGKMGFYFPKQLRTGEARLRSVELSDLNAEQFYWSVASRAGRRVAVIDQVYATPFSDLNGVELIDWGAQYRHFGELSTPANFKDDILQTYGAHPVRNGDAHGGRTENYLAVLEGLVHGVETKARFAADLLRGQHWDLFGCTFGEPHVVGHQFWHFEDSTHRWHPEKIAPGLEAPIRRLYKALDAAVSTLLAAAGNAYVITVASHGIGPNIGGPLLLPEVLVRLGLSSGGDNRYGRALRQLKTRAMGLSGPLKAAVRSLARSRWVQPALALGGGMVSPLESSRTRAAAIPNNRVGAIRLNIIGREPFGSVAPGSGAAELCARLEEELGRLRDPASGETIVERVERTDQLYGPDRHPDLPDLLVRFRSDLGPLEACESPSVGTVRASVNSPPFLRSGDHTAESRIWLAGPDVPAGLTGKGHVLGLAPTVLTLLGVNKPSWLDGTSYIG